MNIAEEQQSNKSNKMAKVLDCCIQRNKGVADISLTCNAKKARKLKKERRTI